MLSAFLTRRPTELNPTEPLAANDRAAELRQIVIWGPLRASAPGTNRNLDIDLDVIRLGLFLFHNSTNVFALRFLLGVFCFLASDGSGTCSMPIPSMDARTQFPTRQSKKSLSLAAN